MIAMRSRCKKVECAVESLSRPYLQQVFFDDVSCAVHFMVWVTTMPKACLRHVAGFGEHPATAQYCDIETGEWSRVL